MATFEVTGPDGGKYQVTAPDDATNEQVMAYVQSQAKAAPATAGDRAQAAAAGINRFALASLPGMPVDTALNVYDLAKAGVGYVGSKFGMKDLPQLTDRSQIVGSSEWLANKEREAGLSKTIDPNIPSDLASRILFATTHAGAAGALGGRGGVPAMARNVASTAASGAAGQSVSEAGGSPSLAMLASFGPQVAAPIVPATLRGVVRGGDAGAAQMQARIDALKAAGIDNPSVGLAAGNRLGAGMDAFLSMAPGASGVMAKATGDMQSGLLGKVSDLARNLSATRGTYEAGDVLQKGIDAYKGRLQDTTGLLYNRVGRLIPDDVLFPATQSLAKGGALSADIPGLPNVSKLLKPDVVPKVNAAMTEDVAPRPAVTTTTPSGLLQASGAPYVTQTTTPASPGGITFPAMKDVRTLIGQDLNDAMLTSNKDKGALKQYYGALTGDMQTAAAITDLARMAASGSTNVPSAVNAMNRANRIYGQGQERLEVLQPFANQVAPERAFAALENSLGSGGAASVGAQVMKSLTPTERNIQTATIVERLGTATPGQQNSTGTAFSPETFLTNWNRMSAAGKDAAFGKSGTPLREDLQNIADSTAMLRAHNKAWANPSGTAAKSTLFGTLSALGGALGTGNLGVAAGLLGGVGGTTLAAKLLTAPEMAQWFANRTTTPPPMPGLLRLATQQQES